MSKCWIILFLLLIPARGQAQSEHYNTSKGLALEGYDAVAYFSQERAVMGNAEIFSVYNGVTYRFQSPHNKETFDRNPDRYIPQYGGWCAYAMGATGEKVEVDPETFKIKDGKLYLFYNSLFNNTLPKWNSNEAVLEGKANRHWSEILSSTR